MTPTSPGPASPCPSRLRVRGGAPSCALPVVEAARRCRGPRARGSLVRPHCIRYASCPSSCSRVTRAASSRHPSSCLVSQRSLSPVIIITRRRPSGVLQTLGGVRARRSFAPAGAARGLERLCRCALHASSREAPNGPRFQNPLGCMTVHTFLGNAILRIAQRRSVGPQGQVTEPMCRRETVAKTDLRHLVAW